MEASHTAANYGGNNMQHATPHSLHQGSDNVGEDNPTANRKRLAANPLEHLKRTPIPQPMHTPARPSLAVSQVERERRQRREEKRREEKRREEKRRREREPWLIPCDGGGCYLLSQ